MDYEGNPISTSVQVKVNRQNWTGHKYEKIFVLNKTIYLDQNGVSEFDFTPEVEGNYNIEVSGKDKKGNKERWYGTFNRLELILDKYNYSYGVGENAKLLINSPIRDISAFITIEGDRIYGYQYITTDGTSALIDIPTIKINGNPIDTELSLGLVDKAIYDLAKDIMELPR